MPIRFRRRSFMCTLGAAALAPASLAFAQSASSWPQQPIKIVVTQGAGAGSDVMARLIAHHLQGAMKHPFIVENKPGAAGAIGHEFVAKAAPDGHTLLLTSTGPLLAVPAMMASARFRYTDFAPIGSLNSSAFVVLVANTPTGPKSLAELRDAIARERATFGSSGAGTMVHLATMMMLRQAKLVADHIPYKTNAQVLQDLVGGQLLFALDSPGSALPLIQSGRVRALAVTGRERMVSLPAVPTLAEAGLPDVEAITVVGLFAPKGLAAPIVSQLNAELNKVLQSPALRDRLVAMDNPPMLMTPSEYERRVAADAAIYEDMVRALNLRTE